MVCLVCDVCLVCEVCVGFARQGPQGKVRSEQVWIVGSENVPIVWGAMMFGLPGFVAIAGFVGSLREVCRGHFSTHSFSEVSVFE